jgi:hypothetical protein
MCLRSGVGVRGVSLDLFHALGRLLTAKRNVFEDLCDFCDGVYLIVF